MRTGDAGLTAAAKVAVDGKFFSLGSKRFRFSGVTYGTFKPREDGARYPDRDQIKRDIFDMADAGFTVVRTYTEPPDDLVELAADTGLHLLAGIYWPDWRYLLGASRRQCREVARAGVVAVRRAARELAGAESVMGLCVGNEVPGDVVRFVGAQQVAAVIAELADAVREEDADRLVTYGNYPTAEYLPLSGLDFLTFNVFLERAGDLRSYLSHLHSVAGDLPVVLGETGLDAGPGPAGGDGEVAQAAALGWQLETALERGLAGTCVFSWTDEWWVGDAAVEGWHFGLTRADRSPRPALDVARRWNTASVASLRTPDEWPGISVVVCAYNAAETLDACLRHACALDYPGLDVVVVDDGSTDATADIARRHRGARLTTIPHGGLSVARNTGWRAARGEIVAYLDADAFPTPEWPYFLALGLDDPELGGVGGPNVPPPGDPVGAERVARAPGGPVHVLTADDRAEHVPGCNMAFRREILARIGGFDPVYTAAGDDVDVCWKVLDAGHGIGFHPSALVWHHRRPGALAYLRQQRGYGRAEALVAARHPDRYNGLGAARWQGRIYNPGGGPARYGSRVYGGRFGTAGYQSVYGGGGFALDVAHQLGVPVAAGLAATFPLALASGRLALPAVLGAALLAALFGVDAARVSPPRALRQGRVRFRVATAALWLAQPLARTWGRLRARGEALHGLSAPPPLAGPARPLPGGVLALPVDGPRERTAVVVAETLRRTGRRILPPSDWDQRDVGIVGSVLLFGDLVTSDFPAGVVQVRCRRRWRAGPSAGAAALLALAALTAPMLGLAVAAVLATDAATGWWRTGPGLRKAVARAAVNGGHEEHPGGYAPGACAAGGTP
jgi:glycosyltransferase involved in cell wall biosynthesis